MTKLRLTILCLFVGLVFTGTAIMVIMSLPSNDLKIQATLFSSFAVFGMYYSYTGAIEEMNRKAKINS